MGFSLSLAYGLPDVMGQRVMACSIIWACESSGLARHRRLQPTSPLKKYKNIAGSIKLYTELY
jgi:hypothetical protein